MINDSDIKKIAFNISFDKYRKKFKFKSINYSFGNDEYINIIISFDNKNDLDWLIALFKEYDKIMCCQSYVQSYVSFQEDVPITYEQANGLVAHFKADNFGGRPVYMLNVDLWRTKYDYYILELLSECMSKK